VKIGKTKTNRRGQAKKLKLKRETLKDLDASKARGVRGGMLYLSGGKGCDVTGACGAIQDKQAAATVACASAFCASASCAKACG